MVTSIPDQAEEQLRLKRALSGDFLRSLVISGVLPWVVVWFLERLGVALIPALICASLLPVVDGAFSWIRERTIDAIGIISLAFLGASIAIALLVGDPHILLFKGALLTGLFALVCLGSLAAPRPLMFYIGRQMTTRGDAAHGAAWDERWEIPQFRGSMRLITAAWGAAYLIEAAARVVIAYTLPPLVVLFLAPIVTYGTLAGLSLWTIVHAGRARRRYAESLEL